MRVLVIVVVLVGFLCPRPVSACSCVVKDVAKSFEVTDAVFVGTVRDLDSRVFQRLLQLLGFGTKDVVIQWSDTIATFDIQEWLKGDDGEVTRVWAETDPAACGVPLEEGEQYLVYAARREGGKLYTDACGRTHNLDLELGDVDAIRVLRETEGSDGGKINANDERNTQPRAANFE